MDYPGFDRILGQKIYQLLKPGNIFITTTNGESKLKDLFEDEIDKYRVDNFVVRGNYAEGKKMFFSCQSPHYLTDKVFSCLGVQLFRCASVPTCKFPVYGSGSVGPEKVPLNSSVQLSLLPAFTDIEQ